MIANTARVLRLLGRELRTGDARITGTVTVPYAYPDRYYVIDDCVHQVTMHVAVEDRPTWARYMEAGR